MDITERVVDDILFQCKSRGYLIMPQLASTVARCLTLKKELTPITTSNVNRLVEMSVSKLTKQDSPQMETIKMQVAMLNARQQIQLGRERELKLHSMKSEQLERSILGLQDETQVFGEIGLYILHKANLLLVEEKDQTPQQQEAMEQTEQDIFNALETVIPRQFIHKFIAKDREAKKLQIPDLWKIVWGIVLYNKMLGNSGHGIQNLDTTIAVDISNKINDLEEELYESEQLCTVYLEEMGAIQALVDDNQSRIKRLRAELTNKRQYCLHLKELFYNTRNLEKNMKHVVAYFRSQIKEIEKKENTVPRSELYLLFMILADNWTEFDTIKTHLNEIERLHMFLKNYKSTFRCSIDSSLASGTTSTKRDVEKQEDDRATSNNLGFAGFDILEFVKNGNIAIPGRNTALIVYQDKTYSFSSEQSAEVFSKNPEHYISSATTLAIRKPELIHLFNLHDLIPCSIVIETKAEKKISVTMVDSELQTETHPVESFIDYKYEFSQWKLRKRALQTADLRNKVTHSSQTDKSHFRRENETQVYVPKVQATQTSKETGTNPKKHIRYIKGLRGDPNQKMSIVNIELELDGPKNQ